MISNAHVGEGEPGEAEAAGRAVRERRTLPQPTARGSYRAGPACEEP